MEGSHAAECVVELEEPGVFDLAKSAHFTSGELANAVFCEVDDVMDDFRGPWICVGESLDINVVEAHCDAHDAVTIFVV